MKTLIIYQNLVIPSLFLAGFTEEEFKKYAPLAGRGLIYQPSLSDAESKLADELSKALEAMRPLTPEQALDVRADRVLFTGRSP